MKDENLVLAIAAASVIGFYLLVMKKPANKTQSVGKTNSSSNVQNIYTNEIFVPQDTANGWRYFDDGTAIDGQGNYYQNGKLIWRA